MDIWYLIVFKVIIDLIGNVIGQGFYVFLGLNYLAPCVSFDEFDFNFQDDCGFSCHLMLSSCQVFD